MESQQVGSVRKTIALKLRDQPLSKVDFTTKREEGELDSGSSNCSLSGLTGDVSGSSGPDYAEFKWDYPVHLIGRPLKDPLLHICEICSLPVLIYGRMKRCRHAFCWDCAKKAGGVCPHCKEGDQAFEEASMGNVHVCIHGGGRYNNKGCGRSYLSQRDLDAHIMYRHHKDKTVGPPSLPPHINPPPPPTSLPAGFTLPPYFQSGVLQHGLPPPPPPPRFGPAMLTSVAAMGSPMMRPSPPMMQSSPLRPRPLSAPNLMMGPATLGGPNLAPISMRPPLASNQIQPGPMLTNTLPPPQLSSTGRPVGQILASSFPITPSTMTMLNVTSAPPPPPGAVNWSKPT